MALPTVINTILQVVESELTPGWMCTYTHKVVTSSTTPYRLMSTQLRLSSWYIILHQNVERSLVQLTCFRKAEQWVRKLYSYLLINEMIIKFTKQLDLLPQPEPTEAPTTQTPRTTPLLTTEPPNKTEADSNYSSNSFKTHPPSHTFETRPTPQAPSSSTTDIHRNSLILIIITTILISIL